MLPAPDTDITAQVVTFVVLAVMLGVVRRRWQVEGVVARVITWVQVVAAFGVAVECVEWWTEWPVRAGLLEMLHVLDMRLVHLGDADITPAALLTVGVVMAVSLQASRLLQVTMRRVFAARGLGDTGTIESVLRLVHYSVLFIGLGIGLQTLGLNLGALFAAGAVFAVGIGLAMQHVAENFVSGLILLVERNIRPGDILEVDGELVRVQHLGIRSTVAATRDDEDLILPNSTLAQGRVKNLVLTTPYLRVRVSVGVAYDSDLRATMAALERAVAALESPHDRPPAVVLTSFDDSAVVFEASVWTENPWGKQQVVSSLSLAIWDALHEDGIVIAFPQLDVHVNGPVAMGA